MGAAASAPVARGARGPGAAATPPAFSWLEAVPATAGPPAPAAGEGPLELGGMLRVRSCVSGWAAGRQPPLPPEQARVGSGTQKASAEPGSSLGLGNGGDFWLLDSSMCFIIIC